MGVNIKICEAKLEDAPQIAEVHIRSWRQAYKGIVHQSYLDDGLDIGERTRRWQEGLSEDQRTTFLAFNGAVLAGFATVGQSRDSRYPDYAELYAIYLDPDYFGKGVGQALFAHAAQYADAHGFTKIFVNVLIDNKAGRNFYKRMGAIPIENSEKTLTIDGQSYMEMKYEWRELTL